jgi:hypothetical protein
MIQRLFLSLCLFLTLSSTIACRHASPPRGGEPIGGSTISASAPEGPPIEGFTFGVASANIKVRPHQNPPVERRARLRAGRNEFEAFQLVFHSERTVIRGISVVLTQPLKDPDGTQIPARNITLYRAGYYDVGTPSNSEGAAGLWPDPLIPDVDTYTGERRNAFPFDMVRRKSQIVWVDLLVPRDAKPGHYRGQLEVRVSGLRRGTIPIELHVGDFILPSTATLRSAFGMDYSEPCMAHTDTESCDEDWDERKACRLRERYIRAGLDHRFTISDVAFQPPFGESAQPFGELILPLVLGRGQTRLPGARTTAVRIDDQPAGIPRWVEYATKQGFADQLFYFPVDDPDDDEDKWKQFNEIAEKLKGSAQPARLVLTATLTQAKDHGASERVDVFVPPIGALDPRDEESGETARAQYEAWLEGHPEREVWAYQSCMSHGCGKCGEVSPAPEHTGWPSRVIDASAVQNRAFSWIAFIQHAQAELYFHVAEQLSTAWLPNGQCRYSGSGDGTLFYPGKPSIIGGKTDIPVESIRVKLIRESMEDYEYLQLAAKRAPGKARAIALELFPRAFQCSKPAHELEKARAKLFQLLDG